MTIRELLAANPTRFVIKAKIWTKMRSTIEAQGPFDPVVGHLVTLLLCRRDPPNAKARKMMLDLTELLTVKS